MVAKIDFKAIENHPVAIEAYNYLTHRGLIRAGSLVPKEAVEGALGRKYEDSWKFLGPYLMLKSKLESEGYFITQDEVEAPGFRILHTNEMADFAMKKLLKNITSNFKIGYILAAHDSSSLTEPEQKRYKSVQQKAAQAALMQQKILIDNQFF